MESELRTVDLHGHPMAYRHVQGPRPDSPVLVLVHGMAGSSATWLDVIEDLGERYTVIAPDLIGHGDSARFRGDYSLGNQASFIRDLMVVLGHERATFVGQSLGGGVVMQVAYQFPQRVERMVLVDSGGLGRQVSTILKMLALPGSGYVLATVTADPVRAAIGGLRSLLKIAGFQLGPEETQMFAAYESLADPKTRKAFLSTLRSVVDHTGQKVSAADRLYLTAERLPLLVVWGDRDPIIPLRHAQTTRDLLPNAQVEVFEGAGHFPHNHQPRRFARLVSDFVDSTIPAELDAATFAESLKA